jgi:FdhD protein
VVVEEAPLQITVNGQELVSLMCTPVSLEDLVLGFLLNEEIISGPDEVARLGVCDDGSSANVRLVSPEVRLPHRWTVTSGCGGGVTSDDLAERPLPTGMPLTLEASRLSELMDDMLRSDPLGIGGRGLHTSALADSGSLIMVTQDVGRHNTLDRIRGECARRSINPEGRLILTTGRISSEMLSKCAKMRVPIVASRTSPTSLSLRLAEEWDMTLIGYLRGQRMDVYTHPERVLTTSDQSE